MADATPDTATPDISGLTSEQLSKYIAMLHLGQGLPNVQPDQTPVDTSGFWGGLRHGISLLGEAAGSPGPETLKALSPKEREQAGLQSLSRFGTGLLAASHYVPGQTFGSNLAQGFQAAEHGYDTTARQAMGMLAARQGYAVESQHADLEKLKAALPLLSLQQQLTGSANTQKLLNGQVTPGTNIGTGGSIAPPDPNSPAGEVAKRTAAFWSSQGFTPEQVAGIMAGGPGAESGFNPGAKGDGGTSLGLYQHHADRMAELVKRYGPNPTDAQQHEFAAWEISPKGPLAAVGAQLRTAKTPQEAAAIWTKGFENPKNADDQAVARASVAGRYLGYGAATPAAPGQATTPPAGRATLPPPEPPMAGTAQTAGPGGPTGTTIPPSPAGSDAAVADIKAGMIGAGADPNTLAPGPGSSPAAQPGAVVTAQAGGQQPALPPPPPIKAGDGFIVHPGTSYQEFFKREAVPPPTTEDFNPNLSQAQQKEFAVLQQGIQQRIANRPNLPIAAQQGEATKIIEDRAALEARIQATIQAKAQAAATNVTKWNEKQEETIRPRYEQMIKSYDAAAQSNLAQQQELAKVEATAKETRATNREQVQNVAAQKLQEDLNKETVAARDRITALDAALELSRNVKDPTLLASRSIGGVPMVDLLKTIGMGGEAFQSRLGAIQELRAGLSAVTKSLRQGVQLGTASDADLRFITSMGASEMQDDSTREAILTNLIGQQHRKMRYGTEVSKLLANGMKIGDAMDEAEKRVPEVTPTLPPELEKAPRGDPRVAAWFSRNVPVNTIWRTEDGTRHIMHAPGWTPPQ